MSKLKIGNVELENNIILAPMAGVSDLPFRLLCKEQGAGLVCMEMISAKAIYYNNKNTDQLMEIHPDEGPVSSPEIGVPSLFSAVMPSRVTSVPLPVSKRRLPLSARLFFAVTSAADRALPSAA